MEILQQIKSVIIHNFVIPATTSVRVRTDGFPSQGSRRSGDKRKN